MLSRRITRPIGIDVGAHDIKAMQLAGRTGHWQVVAAVSIPRQNVAAAMDESELRRLREVLNRRGFSGTGVVLAVPHDRLLSGVFELPPRSSGAPLDQLARMELAQTYKCEPGSLEMATWDVPASGRSSNATHIMAVGCAQDAADDFLDLFEEAGFDVQALDVQAWALARACRPLVDLQSGITAVLEIGWSSANLVVLHQGGVVYVRQLQDSGIRSLHCALADHLDADDQMVCYVLYDVGLDVHQDDEVDLSPKTRSLIATHFGSILDEIRASLSYAAHCYPDTPVQRLLVTGGGAGIPHLAESLSSDLGTEVQIVRPADAVECDTSLLEHCREPATMGALGLAQFEIEDAP